MKIKALGRDYSILRIFAILWAVLLTIIGLPYLIFWAILQF